MSPAAETRTSRLPADFFAHPIAHRGLHDVGRGVIENSLSAISAAVEAGYAIEIDVQLSADGEAVVFHDDDLDRLTAARGLVRAQDAAALGAVKLTGGDDAIPTLPAALAVVAGGVPLVVEIKDQTGRMGPEVGALEGRVAALLSAYDGPVAAMSFNPHSVDWLADIAPQLPIGHISEGRAPTTPAAAVDFISHHWRDLAAPAIEARRRAGGVVISWTIRSPDEAKIAYCGSDQITFEGYYPSLSAK